MKRTRQIEVRAAADALTLTGTAVVFNERAAIGAADEIILPGALDGVNLDGIALLTNHDGGALPLARSPKTLALTVTGTGLSFRAELPDTAQGKALYEAVRRSDIDKMSFAFAIADGGEEFRDNTRYITKIERIFEISPVTFAAYTGTSVYARGNIYNEVSEMEKFNPIESAVMNTAATHDAHATPEYRAAFYKSLLGLPLSEPETRAMHAAQSEKRADSFNTLTNSAAVVPTATLQEIIPGNHTVNGLFGEVRHFAVPANLSVPVGMPTDPAAWHVEGTAVDRNKATTNSVVFSAYELIKILSMSAAVKRMTIGAFESYLTAELRSSIADAIGAAIVNGDGNGKPQGILTGIAWNADNSIETAAITGDNLLSLIALLPQGYGAGAKFAMSTATLFGRIYPLKNIDGDYIFTDAENGGIRRLFGFEIILDDNIPAGIVLFGNFRFYGVNIPDGVLIEASRESGFASGLIDFRALCISDAKPIVPAAFVKLTVTQ